MKKKILWNKKLSRKYPLIKDNKINAEFVWYLYNAHGIPMSLTVKLIKEKFKVI